MRVIHKQQIPLGPGEFSITLPRGAVILDVQRQNNSGNLCMWYLLAAGAAYEEKKLYVFGTGQHIPDGLKLAYVATYQEGGFVWHIFEEFV